MTMLVFNAIVSIADMAEWSMDADDMRMNGIEIDDETELGYDRDGCMRREIRGYYDAEGIEECECRGGEPDEWLTGYEGLDEAENEIRDILERELGRVSWIEAEVLRWVCA